MKKYILLIWGIVALILVIMCFQKGNQQKLLYQQHEEIFEQAYHAYAELQFDKAAERLALLNLYYADNQEVQHLIALNEANLENSESSLKAFQQTINSNPYLLENGLFMVNYLEATLMSGYLEDAKTLLSNCKVLIENGKIQDERLMKRIEQIGVALNGE